MYLLKRLINQYFLLFLIVIFTIAIIGRFLQIYLGKELMIL